MLNVNKLIKLNTLISIANMFIFKEENINLVYKFECFKLKVDHLQIWT